MKYLIRALLLSVVAAALVACGGGGGGGGGGTTILTGTIVNVETGGAPNPQASVQSGGATVLSDASDGSFSLTVPAGTTSIAVVTNSADGTWTFTIPATVAGASQDVGDLWVGPNKVTIAGTVTDSSNGNPIAGAKVSFGGSSALSSSSGAFSVFPVAYPNSNFAAFWGIVGTVSASNYFSNSFSASPNTSVGGVVSVGSVLMTPLSSTTPPPGPYNIWGVLTPTVDGAGATVTLKQGGTTVRITAADGTGTYHIWVAPGTYTLHFQNGSHTVTPDPTVTVTTTSDVERVDAVLN